MTIETLQKEMIAAMKAGDKFRKSVISTTIAQIKNAAIDKGCRDNITETLVDEVLLKAKKTTQEMVDTCPETRQDLLEDYKKQMEIVCEFAPKLITDEDTIKLILDGIFEEIEPIKNNRGKIMKIMSTNYKGKMDMSIVNKMLNNILA